MHAARKNVAGAVRQGHLAERDPRSILTELVEQDRVLEARRYLASLAEDVVPGLDVWRRALAEPRVTVGEPAARSRAGMAPNARWLEERGPDHEGEWVALRAGELVDSDRNLKRLRGRLQAQGESGVDLVYVPSTQG